MVRLATPQTVRLIRQVSPARLDRGRRHRRPDLSGRALPAYIQSARALALQWSERSDSQRSLPTFAQPSYPHGRGPPACLALPVPFGTVQSPLGATADRNRSCRHLGRRMKIRVLTQRGQILVRPRTTSSTSTAFPAREAVCVAAGNHALLRLGMPARLLLHAGRPLRTPAQKWLRGATAIADCSSDPSFANNIRKRCGRGAPDSLRELVRETGPPCAPAPLSKPRRRTSCWSR